MPGEKKHPPYEIENIWRDGEPNREKLLENLKLLYKLWLEDCENTGTKSHDENELLW